MAMVTAGAFALDSSAARSAVSFARCCLLGQQALRLMIVALSFLRSLGWCFGGLFRRGERGKPSGADGCRSCRSLWRCAPGGALRVRRLR